LAKIPIPIVDERPVVVAVDIKAEALTPLIIARTFGCNASTIAGGPRRPSSTSCAA